MFFAQGFVRLVWRTLMPMPPEHVMFVIVALIASGIVVGFAGLVVAQRHLQPVAWWPLGLRQIGDSRHCLYCRFGRSALFEESATVEGNDLVEVQCFVCATCGLPQWLVSRSPVLKKTA